MFTDTNHGGCTQTLKSTSRTVVVHGTWWVKSITTTQAHISLSTGENEFQGTAFTTSSSLGTQVMKDLGKEIQLRICADAQGRHGSMEATRTCETPTHAAAQEGECERCAGSTSLDEKDTGKPSSIEPTLFSRPNIPDHPTRSGRVDLGLFRRSLVEVDDKERCAQGNRGVRMKCKRTLATNEKRALCSRKGVPLCLVQGGAVMWQPTSWPHVRVFCRSSNPPSPPQDQLQLPVVWDASCLQFQVLRRSLCTRTKMFTIQTDSFSRRCIHAGVERKKIKWNSIQ